ncbi:response regulator transcription factor [Subdoligranulum sp. DSM 109015]|uniref:Stage 0 sporulation protein A homolog n=1 Tax=Gemmiger gallinarum TaxID=2779354 RepID=A0ABR9R1Y1_9FIRM|nr:LytTR family DNA-binding domain-containing protein [Gemmiger gallinarum]MBE5037126.1 response regulator transcription factor [Gemmiger gallinarum]
MFHIAIVEDDPQVREQLAGYVRRYERQFGKMFELTAFEDGDEIVSDYKAVYDIILLDVQMRRMDGMAAAEAIRKLDKDVILIFITNMAQFAIRGYAVDALDYVLKPVPYFAFSQQLQKAVDRLRRRRKTFLAVPIDGGLRRVDVSTIYYLESEGHYVRFYTENGELVTPGSLKSYEEKLADKPFARCNSGYLVNLEQVMEVQQNTVRVGPYALQISRPKKKAFLEALTDYIGGSVR